MSRKLTNEQFIEKANKIHNFKYSYDKTIYDGYYKTVIITCPIHGEFVQKPSDHLGDANGCQKCKSDSISKQQTLTGEEVINRFNKIHNFKYSYDEMIYIKNNIKIVIICKDHGKFLITPAKHFIGRGCPVCSKWLSSGEIKVKQILEDLNIDYIMNKQFPDLIGDHKPLKFDFYLEKLNLMIEYDGEFHFNYKCNYNAKNMSENEMFRAFLKTRRYDSIKNKYCETHNIPLLRITYKKYSYKDIRNEIIKFVNLHTDPQLLAPVV